MIVNLSERLVYIDIPKTASSSLDKVFAYGDILKPKASDGLNKHCREIPPIAKDYPRIISVRNPYSRMWSNFNMVLRYSGRIEQSKVPHRSFDEFLDFNIENLEQPSDHWDGNVYRYFPIWKYLEPIGKVDHIIKQENIVEDIKKIKLKFASYLSINNVGKYNKDLTEVYTPERIEKVNIWANSDFENYGYKINEIS